MRITCLLGIRKSHPDGVPEVMVAWDEYCIDSYPEGFEEECEKAKKSWGTDLLAHRLVNIKVSESDLCAAFETPEISGTVET